MAYIKLYFAEDDSVVSENQDNPVEFTLRADLEESEEVRLYAEADEGYSVSDVEVDPTGTSAARWRLAPDAAGPEAGVYGAAGAKIELGTVGVGAGKVYFWAEASAVDTEDPINDTTVTLEVTGVAEAV